MKMRSLSGVITLLMALTISVITKGQSFGIQASALYLSDCNGDNFYNTSGTPPGLIGPSSNTFNGTQFGVHTQNSGTLIFRGGAAISRKVPGSSNVCSVTLRYRVYLQTSAPGAFNGLALLPVEDCNTVTGQFGSGISCTAGDQLWYRVISDGSITPAPVDLTMLPAGNYFLEAYYETTGSSSSTPVCCQGKAGINAGI